MTAGLKASEAPPPEGQREEACRWGDTELHISQGHRGTAFTVFTAAQCVQDLRF